MLRVVVWVHFLDGPTLISMTQLEKEPFSGMGFEVKRLGGH